MNHQLQHVGETKIHDKRLEETSISLESCLPLVTLLDTDIVVSPAYIEFGEVTCTLESMD
jgi:hypothetical protein